MHLRTIIFVAGIATGIVVGLSSPYATELAMVALVLMGTQGIIYALARKRDTKQKRSVALSLCTALFSLAFFAGVVRVQLISEKVPYVCEGSCTVEGTTVSSPESKDTYQTLIVRPEGVEESTYNVQVRTSLFPKYEIGEKVSLEGKVKEPDILFPHGGAAPFDYVSYLHTNDIGSEMLFPKIKRVDGGDGGLRVRLGRWKESFVERINMYVSAPANTLASGMLFGDSSMSKELSDTFRVAGLSHIIVLSGFNIAIVIAFVLFVFSFLPLVVRISLAALSVLLFVVMVGGEASVIRATLMSFIALLSMLVGREYVARQALMLSFLAIILYDPVALTDSVSFHLSFLATAGIVYLSDPIKTIIAPFIRQTFFLELFTTTLAAYIATLPYVMHTFGTVSAYALLANMLVLPLVPAAMFLAFLTLLSSFIFPTIALVFGFIDSSLINLVLFVVQLIARLPGASFSIPLSFGWMCAAYVVLPILLFILSRKKKDETLHTTPEGYLTDVITY